MDPTSHETSTQPKELNVCGVSVVVRMAGYLQTLIIHLPSVGTLKVVCGVSSQQSRRRRPGRPARPMSTFERRPVIDGTH